MEYPIVSLARQPEAETTERPRKASDAAQAGRGRPAGQRHPDPYTASALADTSSPRVAHPRRIVCHE